jgi:hypothetical protein
VIAKSVCEKASKSLLEARQGNPKQTATEKESAQAAQKAALQSTPAHFRRSKNRTDASLLSYMTARNAVEEDNDS